MKLDDILKLSFNSLSHRGLRSWLTILGIVIGVGAVVAIISMGEGMQQSISSQLGDLGADVITVTPGFNRAFGGGFRGHGGGGGFDSNTNDDEPLANMDLQIIKSVPGVKTVSGTISGNADISYLAEESSASIEGIDPLTWSAMNSVNIASGRFLNVGDNNVVVIGSSIANDRFKQSLMINTQIIIEGKSYRIVGILEESSSGFSNNRNTIYITVNAARGVLEDLEPDELSEIFAQVNNVEQTETIISEMETKLMLSRHVTESTKDFTVTSAASTQETISEVMGTITVFLGGIAAVSLIVGAIGIANTMFMSVMERTRQIGILKALGTTNAEVMKLFLFESAIIGLVGGLLGVFFGFIISGLMGGMGVSVMGGGRFGSNAYIITPQLIMFSLAFSVGVGVISGILPARRAASLPPVEALRYE